MALNERLNRNVLEGARAMAASHPFSSVHMGMISTLRYFRPSTECCGGAKVDVRVHK